MSVVQVTTRHGTKVHDAVVDDATADFLDRFGSAPSIQLVCGRHPAIVRKATSLPTSSSTSCTQCTRTTGGTP